MMTLLPLALVVDLGLTGLLRAGPGSSRQASTMPAGQASPAGEEQSQHSAGDVLAVIVQSRSTNTLGYRLVIHIDGSATAEIGSGATGGQLRSQPFAPGAIDVAALRRLLDEIGDVSRIPTGFCPKSVSFGTRTEITYAGKTSGDLQCVQPQPSQVDAAPLAASKNLAKFVRTILDRLKVNDRRFSPNR
jgi:hypothetical protein